MFGIGSGELFLIVIVAVLVLGPEHLPRIMRTVQSVMSNFRKITTEFQRTLNLEDVLKETDSRPTAKRTQATTKKKKKASSPSTAKKTAKAPPKKPPTAAGEPSATPSETNGEKHSITQPSPKEAEASPKAASEPMQPAASHDTREQIPGAQDSGSRAATSHDAGTSHPVAQVLTGPGASQNTGQDAGQDTTMCSTPVQSAPLAFSSDRLPEPQQLTLPQQDTQGTFQDLVHTADVPDHETVLSEGIQNSATQREGEHSHTAKPVLAPGTSTPGHNPSTTALSGQGEE